MHRSTSRGDRNNRSKSGRRTVKISLEGIPATINPDALRNWKTAHGTSLVDGSVANSIKYNFAGDSVIMRLSGQTFSGTTTDMDVFCQEYLTKRGLAVAALNGTKTTA